MGGLSSWLRQVVAVSWMNLRNIGQRFGSSLVTVIGVAGVVMVFIGVLSVARGFKRTLEVTGDPENVLVMRSGSDSEMVSLLGLEDTRIISDAAELERDGGRVASSSELFVIIDRPRVSSDSPANVPLRGLDPATALDVRGNVEITVGRMFEPGRNEVIVGEATAAQFAGLQVGDQLPVGEDSWEVVGHFSTGGTVAESEIWCDAKVLQPAYQRGSSFQSVHARLSDADRFTAFKDRLTADPRLDVKVLRENDYYAEQGTVFTQFVSLLGVMIGGLMGFGAVFGAVNTMYTAVSARSREIATLRAIGFGSGPVVISVLLEALLLALIGGVTGAILAYVMFNGYRAATINFQSFSQIAFNFSVTPALMVGGIVYALIMGLVGGFFPAWRAARLPVATALREL